MLMTAIATTSARPALAYGTKISKKPIFPIAERYPLADVVNGHLAVERGEKIGHVILNID